MRDVQGPANVIARTLTKDGSDLPWLASEAEIPLDRLERVVLERSERLSFEDAAVVSFVLNISLTDLIPERAGV